MTAWLKLALGIVALLQWIAQRLDDAERQRLITTVTEGLLRDEIDKIIDRMRRASEPDGVPRPDIPDRYFRD